MSDIGLRAKGGAVLVCVQCAMKEIVEALDAGIEPGPATWFSATMTEHTAVYHPDPDATLRERRELVRRFAAHHERVLARARNAQNN